MEVCVVLTVVTSDRSHLRASSATGSTEYSSKNIGNENVEKICCNAKGEVISGAT